MREHPLLGFLLFRKQTRSGKPEYCREMRPWGKGLLEILKESAAPRSPAGTSQERGCSRQNQATFLNSSNCWLSSVELPNNTPSTQTALTRVSPPRGLSAGPKAMSKM